MNAEPILLQAGMALGLLMPYLILFFVGIPILIAITHFTLKAMEKGNSKIKFTFKKTLFNIAKVFITGIIGFLILLGLLFLIFGNDIER